jgi:hypothetical protein
MSLKRIILAGHHTLNFAGFNMFVLMVAEGKNLLNREVKTS